MKVDLQAMKNLKQILKIIVIVLVLYSILGLFGQFIFSYFNQSPYQERQLTLLNFVLPWFITLGFMIYGSIFLYRKPRKTAIIWFMLVISGSLEIISVKWQIEFSLWAIKKEMISEMIPILTGLLMTIYFFTTLIRLILSSRINCLQHLEYN